MGTEIEVAVPDIGDFQDVDVIDVLVRPGDIVGAEDPLITLESDKATMDIPAPQAGRIIAVLVKVGDKVSEGNAIIAIEPLEHATAAATAVPGVPPVTTAATASVPAVPGAPPATAEPPAAETTTREVRVPVIGDFEQVDVIDVLVKVGELVSADSPLVTLESDKATMDIPAPQAGRVLEILVKVGDKVSEGDPIVLFAGQEVSGSSPATAAATAAPRVLAAASPAPTPATSPASRPNAYGFDSPDPGPRTTAPPAADFLSGTHVYASPAMRRFARELGVDLTAVRGSGRKQRILREDITAHVKQSLQRPAASATAGDTVSVLSAPVIDFTKFGTIETTPLSRIRRLTGQNLHRAWVTIPHVTQFDAADITELEAFRRAQLAEAEKQGARLTLVAFVVRAVTATLRSYPDFNASLSADGEALIHKQYCHIGVAVNTPRGLLVPVVRDADTKGIHALAREIRELSVKARDGKLAPADMQGGCFTITSLGGVSGTGFTPIINPPEVAILGLSPAAMQPVYRDGAFVPRLLLPLSLSYDHRVIDGVAAAEFSRHLAQRLADLRLLLL